LSNWYDFWIDEIDLLINSCLDCGQRYHPYTRNCLGTQINLDRLAQSIRQLIIETKV